jgi:hypothetical protein
MAGKSDLEGKDEGTASPTDLAGSLDNNPEQGYMSLLRREFSYPVLSVLEAYLHRSNGQKKTKENCVYDFRRKHAILYKIAMLADLSFRFLYLSIILLIVLRGIGLFDVTAYI